MKNAIASDFSWHKSAQEYLHLYENLMAEKPAQEAVTPEE